MARQILYERSHALKTTEANVESKRQSMESLKLLHGPTIGIQGVELWGETHIDLSRQIPTPLGTMGVAIDEDYNFSGPRAAISGTMPIFTGGKIPAMQKAGKFAVDEAEARHRGQSVELDAELIGKYFGLQLARSLEKFRADVLAQEDRELERAVKFEREGMISPVERMGVKVARDKAAREHFKAVNDVKTATVQLRRLLLDENVAALSTPLFVLKNAPRDIDYWVKLALGNNPQISLVEARAKQAGEGVKIAKSSWSPQVFAFGQYSLIRHYQTIMEPTWLAGIGASLTLWDAKDRMATYKSAKAALRGAREALAEAVNQVRGAAETAWLGMNNARGQYNLTASDVALAKENLRLKSRGFGEGLYTALNVTEARNRLVEAEVGRRVAAFQFVVNYAMLHAMAGNMNDFMRAFENGEVILEP